MEKGVVNIRLDGDDDRHSLSGFVGIASGY